MNPYRRPSLVPVLGLLLVVAGFGLGTGLVARPELVLPLTLESLFLAILTFGLVAGERDPDLRGWLVRLVFLAMLARFGAMLVVHYVFSPNFFVLDSIGYERLGSAISLHWQGLGPRPEIPGQGILPSYYHLNAVFHYLLGDPSWAAVVLNLFAGLWTVVLSFKLARELMGKEVAKTVAIFTAFFPSLILWSVLNIRDALAAFAVTLTVLYGVRTFRHPHPLNLAVLGLAVVMLTALRDYMGFLCVAGLVLGAVAAVRPGHLFQTLVGGTILVGFLSFLADRLDLFPAEVLEDPFSSATRMREGLQFGATSAYGPEHDTTTLGGSLLYLPLGFAYLLFAPFPWAIETSLQAAAAPETFLWYPVFLLSLVGMRRAAVRGGHLNIIPFAVLLVVTTSYALVEGNFGTAYRHRAQIMPLFFIFAGVGVAALRPWFEQRKRMRKQSVLFRRGREGEPTIPHSRSHQGRRRG